MKERLDILLVQRGLAPSREKAKAMIMEGNVFVSGQREDKAGTAFDEKAEIEVRGNTLKYVSRGGLKLEKAMEQFTVDESCGKCTPCRIGTKRLYELLDKITKGKATMEDLDKLETLCYHIKENALCGLGQTAPNPVLSTLKYFRDEYVAHIVEKRCPAGVCKSLLTIQILPDKCRGCTLCARNCPTGAISGKVKEAHVIDTEKCVKCGVCIEKCRFGAIVKK